MLKHTSRWASIALMITCSLPTQANFIDHITYTTDTTSGLDWLDVSASVNKSFYEVNSLFGSEYAGWRYATLEEVETLVKHYAGDPIPTANPSFFQYGTGALTGLLSMLGYWIHFQNQWIELDGLTSTIDASNRVMFVDLFSVTQPGSPTLDYLYTPTPWDQGYANTSMGSFLVRGTSTTVPELNILGIFLSSLLGLFLIRKRKVIRDTETA